MRGVSKKLELWSYDMCRRNWRYGAMVCVEETGVTELGYVYINIAVKA